MTSPLLALFIRSVREELRSRATYWARGALGGFLLIILASFALENFGIGAQGKLFFITVISFQGIAITLVGLSYFGSAIAEEKEEQTLGLLRMTSLNALAILLGKSTSRLWGVLLLLVGQIPFTIFAVTLGGTSLDQIAASYCTVGAFTFLLCNLSLLGSVLARRTSGAVAFSVLLLAILAGGGPLLGWGSNRLTHFPALSRAFGTGESAIWEATPVARLQEVLGTGFSGAPVGWQVLSNVVLGIACFLMAWAVFERCSDRLPESAAPVAAGGPRLPWLRRPRPWKNAILWKDFYFLCGGALGLVVRVLGYGAMLVPLVCQVLRVPGFVAQLAPGVDGVASFAFTIDVALMASRIFGSEWREQTLTALATLPCTIREIVWRKTCAFLLAAAPGFFLLVTIQAIVLQSQSISGAAPNVPFPMWKYLLAENVSGWITTVLMVQVVAWLALYLKRGAAPIGIVGTYAAMAVVALASSALFIASTFRTFAVNGPGTPNFLFLLIAPALSAIVGIVATIVIRVLALRRLEVLAGES